ncbi:glycosyltransferase 8 domain-containing protein 1-like [Saccoglossus kowalevskii]
MTATSDELSAEDVGKSDQEKTVMTKVIPGKENAGISDDIHIIISADNDHFIGVATLINSILHTARLPSNIKFHIVVAGQPAESFKEYLQCCGLQVTDKINVIELNDSWLSGRIHVFSSIKDVGNLASLANFARFYFDRIFPSLQKALYIDADCVVQQPIEDLWNIAKDAKTPLVAVSRDIVPYGHFFDEKVLKVFFERYGKRFSESEPTFNAGVFVIDLLHYREKQLVDEAEFWMNQNAKKKLWKFGSQPVMLMMYHGQWTKLDSTWNVDSLGWKDTIGTEKLKTAGILHWNGAKKPWLHNGLYKAYWQRYQPSQCSGHGNCVSNSTARNGSYWYCQCGVGYHGKYCLESSIP